jgi:hypothetical protein
MLNRRSNLIGAVLSLLGVLAGSPVALADDVSAAAEKPAPSASQIAAWIADLDDVRYLVREKASQQLFAAGTAVLDPLLAAANTDHPEPADRALWILQRLSRSREDALAIAALERLVRLEHRPAIVAKAEAELGERSLSACEQRLTSLGAEFRLELGRVDVMKVAPFVHVRLGGHWHGTTDDLRAAAELPQQFYFRFEGAPVDDAVARMFENREKLSFLQFIDTKVTPDAIDALKQRHPDAVVYLRNQAMLGVGGESVAAGVLVTDVRAGTAAATAGIMQNDVITTIDGHALPDFDRLTVRIAQHQPGDKINIEILRGDQRLSLYATLGSWEGQE